MNTAELAGRLLPPVLADKLRDGLGRRMRFTLVDGGWREAVAASTGYDADTILQCVAAATRAVRQGLAAYERDSVLFTQRAVPFHLAAPLLRHALQHGGQLEVIDFGGSLGSVYQQLRWFLPPLQSLRWHVIEQPNFVAAGRAEFANDELQFHSSVQDLPPATTPRVVLLSSVLQYLPDPQATLESLCHVGGTLLLIDRTPFTDGPEHRLCIQHSAKHVYRASYPAWILSKQRLREQCGARWSTMLEFVANEGYFKTRGIGEFAFESWFLESAA